MNYKLVTLDGGSYLAAESADAPLRTEQDALDLIGACFGSEVQRVLLLADALAAEFFRLGTRTAGDILQKFVNYQIKVAAVVPDESVVLGKSREMLAELNKGRDFRVFANQAEAEQWLLDG